MKKFTKNLWVSATNGVLGKALVAFVTLIIALIGIRIALPEISVGNVGIVGGFVDILKEFKSIIVMIIALILVYGYCLLMERMQVGITKQKNKDDAEIKKLELTRRLGYSVGRDSYLDTRMSILENRPTGIKVQTYDMRP